MTLQVSILPALEDNYIYLLAFDGGQKIVIDPGEAEPVLEMLHNAPLTAILLTHHHADHTGGVAELVKKTGCTVYGNSAVDKNLPPKTQPISFTSPLEDFPTPITVLPTPGHTEHHVSYYIPQYDLLFSGDFLFSAGCGRLLGGTADQMYKSLQMIKKLPQETQIFCGHEYTIKNLQFALSITPSDTFLQKHLEEAEALRAQNKPTVPSMMYKEKSANLFMKAASLSSFKRLRKARDHF